MSTTAGTALRIRFTPDDIELSLLHAAAFGSAPVAITPWAERLERHALTWVGAFDGGALVGFVQVAWDGGEHAFLLDTVVHPDHRRLGLGRAVVRAGVAEARKARCAWLHVDYEPHLDRFYRQGCGFTPTAAGLLALQE